MKIKKIIYSIIILFLIYSCDSNKIPNTPDYSSTTNKLNMEFDYPFVINEKEINGKCIEMYKNWLKPTAIESVELLGIYKLDIELDSIIYKSDTYKNAFFIGVKYRFNEEVSHLIWALLFERVEF